MLQGRTYMEGGDVLCIRRMGDVARACESGELVEIECCSVGHFVRNL